MPKFESDITANKPLTIQGLREFDVPDASEMTSAPPLSPHRQRFASGEGQTGYQTFQASAEPDMSQIEQEMRQARLDKRQGKERLSGGAKRRIELLIGMTKQTRQVMVEDNLFVLQSLNGKEMQEAIMAAAEFDGTVQSPFELRRQLLARSLIQVAELEIAQFIGSNDLEVRLEFIDKLDDALLNRLYNEYLSLKKETQEKFSMPKTEVDAKEVMEDLKK